MRYVVLMPWAMGPMGPMAARVAGRQKLHDLAGRTEGTAPGTAAVPPAPSADLAAPVAPPTSRHDANAIIDS